MVSWQHWWTLTPYNFLSDQKCVNSASSKFNHCCQCPSCKSSYTTSWYQADKSWHTDDYCSSRQSTSCRNCSSENNHHTGRQFHYFLNSHFIFQQIFDLKFYYTPWRSYVVVHVVRLLTLLVQIYNSFIGFHTFFIFARTISVWSCAPRNIIVSASKLLSLVTS